MSKIDLVKKFISAYNSLDVERMITCLHPKIEFRNISSGIENAHTKGIKEFKDLSIKSLQMFKEREQKITSHTELDDTVNVEINFNGILAMDLPNGLKIGETLALEGKSTYVFKDDLIILLIDDS